MKIIAPAAMAAIEAGEAIVTEAVEFFPRAALPDIIATGTAVELDWQQNTFIQTGGNDEARMGLAYFDQANVQIGATNWAAFTQPTVWTARTIADVTPAGAAVIRAMMEMRRLAGTHCDGYVDAIELKVAGALVPLRSPGAEQGTAGWVSTTGGIDYWNDVIGNPGTPAPYSGAYFFAGGNNASSVAHQDYATYSNGAPIRVWGGHGTINLDGSDYLGMGARALVQQTGGALGGVAQGLTLSLSAIDPAALELLDADEIRGAPVVIHRLIFASDAKTLLGYEVWDRGRVDTVSTEEIAGGTATILVAVESAARGLGRGGGRQLSDSDQRLINPADGYAKNTSFAPNKDLYWGGTRPVRTGDAHGGTVAGTAGGSGAGF